MSYLFEVEFGSLIIDINICKEQICLSGGYFVGRFILIKLIGGFLEM